MPQSCYTSSVNIVLFEPEELNEPLSPQDARFRHLRQVLRKGAGDSFEAGLVNGASGTAEILSVSAAGLEFRFTPGGDGKPLHPLIMIVGFPRPIQLKRLLRDIASLGVRQVHLCGTELGEKSYLKATLSRPEELSAMLKDGAVQAKSTHVPQVAVHQNVRQCVDAVLEGLGRDSAGGTGAAQSAGADGAVDPAAMLAALDNVEPATSLNRFLAARTAASERPNQDTLVVAAIGSERGWTANERQIFRDRGFALCGMGERVLRTETAATAAAAIILSHLEIL